MLNASDDMQRGDRPDISRLIARLARDSRDWAEAEITLAQVELAELKTRALKAAGLAAMALAALIAAMLALTQATIALLGSYLPGAGIAALAVAIILALATAGCAFAARRALAWRAESIFFRWLGSRPQHGDGP